MSGLPIKINMLLPMLNLFKYLSLMEIITNKAMPIYLFALSMLNNPLSIYSKDEFTSRKDFEWIRQKCEGRDVIILHGNKITRYRWCDNIQMHHLLPVYTID